MPLYTYKCAHGHLFDQRVRIDLSDAPQSCDFPMPEGAECGQQVSRMISAPTRLFPGADSWRKS